MQSGWGHAQVSNWNVRSGLEPSQGHTQVSSIAGNSREVRSQANVIHGRSDLSEAYQQAEVMTRSKT